MIEIGKAALLLVSLLSSVTGSAAILPPIIFGNTGTPVMTFDNAPPVQQFATMNTGGANTSITDFTGLDTAGKTNIATLFTTALPNLTGNPAADNNVTVWSSGGFLQTRPTGVAYNALLATLSNATASAISGFGIRYDFTVFATNAPGSEQIPGTLVYYSMDGTSGSWVQMPQLSDAANDETSGTYSRAADVTLGSPWSPGAKLYILWVDDNGNPISPDDAYQIDNLQFVTLTPAAPAFADNTDPTNRTALQCASTTLSAGPATGVPAPTYQWYKTDTTHPISGATSVSYTIANIQPADAGTYLVKAVNSQGAATSHVATLTVALAPAFAVISAIAMTNPTVYVVSFDRAVDPATVDTNAFGFDLSGDLQGSLNAASVMNGTNILLTSTTARTPGVNYGVTLAPNVAAACPNDQSFNVSAGPYNIASQIYLVQINDGGWQYNESGLDPGSTWKDKGYNDTQAGWQTGQGVFDAKSGSNRVDISGTPVNTHLSLSNVVNFPSGDVPTYYFRKHFNFAASPSGATLTLRPFFDDSAVIYLNGVQIGQIGFANPVTGPLVYSDYGTSLSSRTVGDAAFDTAPYPQPGGYTNLPIANLVAGDNVLAIELKQINGTSSDITMGLELTALVPSFLPVLNAATDSCCPDEFDLIWTNGVLQLNTNVSRGTGWHDVPGAKSPWTVYTTPGFGPGKVNGTNTLFFRVRE